MAIEPLGLSAKQWQFLHSPDKYVKACVGALLLKSTRRQFRTARDILTRLNGSYGTDAKRGILLADDVGLGKTTVAALVAWVVASAGNKRRVRILAPNDVMMRRWEYELKFHVQHIKVCAPHLKNAVSKERVKVGKSAVSKLRSGAIQVVKHSYAVDRNSLSCDLLIIDEAHRAKDKNSKFSRAIRQQSKGAKRILILTATPFSIHLNELQQMLKLIGGDSALSSVNAYTRTLNALYRGNTAQSVDDAAERLAQKAKEAVEALRSFVIRHSIDDLKSEQNSLGLQQDWNIHVDPASPEELELMLRMDRALRLDRAENRTYVQTNDPRFHVGWKYYDMNCKKLAERTTSAEVQHHLNVINNLRSNKKTHPKISALGKEVEKVVDSGEKVILFCHHHATAQELTEHIGEILPKRSGPKAPSVAVWRDTWEDILETDDKNYSLRSTFINWLCSYPIRTQITTWINSPVLSQADLRLELIRKIGRLGKIRPKNAETIAEAAQRLYDALLRSRSSYRVLKKAAVDHIRFIPGAVGKARVLGVCAPTDQDGDNELFVPNEKPDTIISIFNSPFGPDVLVVTDRLSEGIDLHRYCRHLIHYELDPSPIRTVQRNGRLRRVNSWASITGEPIYYAYPAFQGTRDHRLVQIMKKRLDSFSILLGGAQDFSVEEVVGVEEQWRNEVIAKAKKQLMKAGVRLKAD